jgi:uncharacterized protein (DUF1501 family)
MPKTDPTTSAATAHACACADWSRSELLRGAAAQAGRGLPAIEPGMPTPAGTGLSRRSFLLRSAGLALAVYGARSLAPQAFEEGIAAAAAAGPSNAVLVSVFLSGGIDAMSVLAPTGDPQYRVLRPTLALPPDDTRRMREDPRLQWHPSADKLKTLYDEGKVTVLPAVGYSSPNFSHFTSRHYWEVGAVNPQGRDGWLGRYLDRHGVGNNPLQGLSLQTSLSPALATTSVPVAAVPRPDQYRFTAQGVSSPIDAPMLTEFGRQGALASGDPTLTGAREVTASTATLRQQVSAFSSVTSPVTYPTGNEFSYKMASVAAMLAGGLPLKVVTMDAAGGYDTHADQATRLTNDLRYTADTLFAFQRDLEARGLADRVLVNLWSEFGRRADENSSGTDHGAAGVQMIIGSKASGHMVNEFPGMASGTGGGLDKNQNIRSTSDFRGAYCSLLEQWLGVDPAPIIPGASGFPRYQLVA